MIVKRTHTFTKCTTESILFSVNCTQSYPPETIFEVRKGKFHCQWQTLSGGFRGGSLEGMRSKPLERTLSLPPPPPPPVFKYPMNMKYFGRNDVHILGGFGMLSTLCTLGNCLSLMFSKKINTYFRYTTRVPNSLLMIEHCDRRSKVH